METITIICATNKETNNYCHSAAIHEIEIEDDFGLTYSFVRATCGCGMTWEHRFISVVENKWRIHAGAVLPTFRNDAIALSK